MGHTPLHLAAMVGAVEIGLILLAAGTKLWALDDGEIIQRSAIRLARDFGHQSFVIACLKFAEEHPVPVELLERPKKRR